MRTTKPNKGDNELMARLDERLKAQMDKLELIHEEVKKTNGRVSSLETWRSEIRGSWKATILLSSGMGALIGFLGHYFF